MHPSFCRCLQLSVICIGTLVWQSFADTSAPKRFQTITVRRNQLNTLLPPYNVCIEIATSGPTNTIPSTRKGIQCIVLRGETYDPNIRDYSQIKKQLIPYSYTWKILSEDNKVLRSWPLAFFQNRNFVYRTDVRLPLEEFSRSVLEIYFEDIDGDGMREDVTFVVDMSEFDWSPSHGPVYQSGKVKLKVDE